MNSQSPHFQSYIADISEVSDIWGIGNKRSDKPAIWGQRGFAIRQTFVILELLSRLQNLKFCLSKKDFLSLSVENLQM